MKIDERPVIGQDEWDVTLPSLIELRAFYAARINSTFDLYYDSQSCLIAIPASSIEPYRRFAILPTTRFREGRVEVTSGLGVRVEYPLPPVYDHLAIAFDVAMSVETTLDGAECVALIDGFIAEEEMNDAR